MIRWVVAAALAVPVLSGCVVYDEAVLPVLTGEFHGDEQRQPTADDSTAAGMERLTPQASAIVPDDETLQVADSPSAPLAVVRFHTPDVAFEEALQPPIARALAAQPDASFSLVAVSSSDKLSGLEPLNETASQRNVERVLAAMTKAGVAENRVIFAAASDDSATVDEVRIYLLDLVKVP